MLIARGDWASILVRSILAGILLVAAALESPACGQEPARRKKPPENQLAEARKLVKDLIGTEKKGKKSAAENSQLVDKLLETAAPEQDAASGFVLLSTACSRAVTLEQWQKASSLLSARFDDKLAQYKLDGLISCKEQVPAAKAPDYVQSILSVVDEAERSDEFDVARSASLLGKSVSATLKDKSLEAIFTARMEQTQKVALLWTQCKPAFAKFDAETDKPSALICGQYDCFVRDRWKQGLELIAAATEGELAELAKRDLATPSAEEEQKKLADDWWAYSEGKPAINQKAIRRRAAYWYGKTSAAMGDGLTNLKVTKRIAEGQPDLLASWRTAYEKNVIPRTIPGRYKVIETFRSGQKMQIHLFAFLPNNTVTDGTNVISPWKFENGALIFTTLGENGGTATVKYVSPGRWEGQFVRRRDGDIWPWALVQE